MKINKSPLDKNLFAQSLKEELTGNILPFWLQHALDSKNGGFYGAVANDRTPLNDVPRSVILCARILWTFSAAHRLLGNEEYLAMARRAYEYLTTVFLDPEFGGLYWEVDYHGQPVVNRKHHYAQAFGIYGLTEYYRVSQDAQSLALARDLFALLERHAYEPVQKGYIEGSSRDWSALEDMRLSDKEIHCRKSMNTLLHILEAYTNLLRVWDDAKLREQHQSLIDCFEANVVDRTTGHLRLFFQDDWTPLPGHYSYGHDIEAAWLLQEAAEMHPGSPRIARAKETAVLIAETVFREALEADGGLLYEGSPQGVLDTDRNWWPQAEAIVGFYNAYQVSGKAHFAEAALRCWTYIENHMVDRTHGEWFKIVRKNGDVDRSHYKIGPWECPYHHSRMCLEMLERLKEKP